MCLYVRVIGRLSTVGVSRYSSRSYSTGRAMASQARVWCMSRAFDGAAKIDDFGLQMEPLKPLQAGQVLLKAQFCSVDPYMKALAGTLKAGDPMPGAQIATVLESQCEGWPVGGHALVSPGWRDLTVCAPGTDRPGGAAPILLPSPLPVSASHYVGVAGMTGLTAYHTVRHVMKPAPGEVVVVSGAAGAVGSLVGQIAKIDGARVVGYAGSDDKVAFLKQQLGFDEAFNYKTQDLAETLRTVAPDGVNCYYDAVGGSFTATVMHQMAPGGRVAVIGFMSNYNDKTMTPTGPFTSADIVMKQLTLKGWQYFAQDLASKEMMDARQQLATWTAEGKLRAEETFKEGFENMPQAFLDMMLGKGTGKMVVKA